MGLLVHALEVGLPGQSDERRAVEEGVGHAGEEVRRPRPERAEADTGALGQAAVHVRHVGAPLLMANRDEIDGRVVEGFVEVQGLLARDAEDVLDPLDLQALHEKIRRLALHAPKPLPPVMSGQRSPNAPDDVCSDPPRPAGDRRWRPSGPRRPLERAVGEYIGWSNHDRLHESLGDLAPAQFEARYAPRTETPIPL